MNKAIAFAVLSLALTAASIARADDTYEVSQTNVETTVGAPAKAHVTITAKKGWHLNAEAPMTLKLTAEQGIALDKPKLTRADLAMSTETAARFEVALTASQPGSEMVAAEAGFVLCQESACRPIREKLSIAVITTTPKAAPAPAKKARKRK
jgi:hypothetical protein